MDSAPDTLTLCRRTQAVLLMTILVLYSFLLACEVHNCRHSRPSYTSVIHRSLSKLETVVFAFCGFLSGVALAVSVWLHRTCAPNNLHGRLVTCFMASGMVVYPAQAALAVVDNFHPEPKPGWLDDLSDLLPKAAGLVLSCWLLAVAHHLWNTFNRSPMNPTGKDPPGHKRRLVLYCFLGWGFPATLLVLHYACVAFLQFGIPSVFRLSWYATLPLNAVLLASTALNVKLHDINKTGTLRPKKKAQPQGVYLYAKLVFFLGLDRFFLLLSLLLIRNGHVMFFSASLVQLSGVVHLCLIVNDREVLKKLRGRKGNTYRLDVNHKLVCKTES